MTVDENTFFTPRQQQVLQAMIDGCETTDEIAQRLGMSPNTVKSHLYTMNIKARTKRRWTLLAKAIRNGWIDKPVEMHLKKVNTKP